jgi:hypothetical protein
MTKENPRFYPGQAVNVIGFTPQGVVTEVRMYEIGISYIVCENFGEYNRIGSFEAYELNEAY